MGLRWLGYRQWSSNRQYGSRGASPAGKRKVGGAGRAALAVGGSQPAGFAPAGRNAHLLGEVLRNSPKSKSQLVWREPTRSNSEPALQ